MSGCAFSKSGMSWESTSPSRPIAQMRRVVLLPADAEEQPRPVTSSMPAAARHKTWLGICLLEVDAIVLTGVFMGWRGLTSVLVLLVAIAACTEPSEPSSISAQFILTDVD